jgi:uncharacterized membrane-anchored protein YitT (DUF2179 family)
MTDISQNPDSLRHTVIEDALAFTLGTAMCALSLIMLTHLGLITGQTAGLGVLLSYLTGYSFGEVFFVLNIPFYALALWQMGIRFTLRSFLAVAMLSLMTEFLPHYISFADLNPLVGALMAGALAGLGIIVLFRHSTSLGGLGVLALYVQDRFGFRAGWVGLIFDAVLFSVALTVMDSMMVMYSVLGAAVINVTIALNHRKDRYIGR